METIHQLIRFWREYKHFSQQAMAADLGISQQEYSLLEAGKASITAERFCKIADILGIALEDLRPGPHNRVQMLSDKAQPVVKPVSPPETVLHYEKLVESKNETISAQNETISSQKETIAVQKETISTLSSIGPHKHIGKPEKNKRAA
jgi:transcriptional regulator with XRE-family HTH domain